MNDTERLKWIAEHLAELFVHMNHSIKMEWIDDEGRFQQIKGTCEMKRKR